MAYFLDAELNDLTTGAKKAPSRAAAPVNGPSRRRSNKFPKPCHTCHTYVRAGEGYLDKLNGAWVVYCTDCP